MVKKKRAVGVSIGNTQEKLSKKEKRLIVLNDILEKKDNELINNEDFKKEEKRKREDEFKENKEKEKKIRKKDHPRYEPLVMPCNDNFSERFIDGPIKKVSDEAHSEMDAFEWLIHPISKKDFLETYWEKRPLVLKRQNPNYYGNLFSMKKLLIEAEKETLEYSKHINLGRFNGNERVKENVKEDGERVTIDEIDGSIKRGISCQAMHPQQYDREVQMLMEKLETAIGCAWGSNSYYSPAKAQFAAPHFDDVEVFMLQVEGSKTWEFRETNPEWEIPKLPKEYSPDYSQKEKSSCPLLYKCDIEQGDLVYLPRGTIHEGQSLEHTASHHLTVSTYQKFSFFHLLQDIIPNAMEKAFKGIPEFQRGLDFNFHRCFGTFAGMRGTMEKSRAAKREKLKNMILCLARQLTNEDIDEAIDGIRSEFTLNRLPPGVPKDLGPSPEAGTEKNIEVRIRNKHECHFMLDVDPETKEDCLIIFHPYLNQKKQHMCGNVEESDGTLRLELLFLPVIQHLTKKKSNEFIPIRALPLSADDNEAICELLYEAQIIETRQGEKKDVDEVALSA